MTPTETEALAGRIDQIIGWAKSGIRGEYYLMDRENVDTMRDDILRAMTPSASDARWNRLREHVTAERAALDETAAEHAEYGRDDQSERCYEQVRLLDRLLAVMDRIEAGQ